LTLIEGTPQGFAYLIDVYGAVVPGVDADVHDGVGAAALDAPVVVDVAAEVHLVDGFWFVAHPDVPAAVPDDGGGEEAPGMVSAVMVAGDDDDTAVELVQVFLVALGFSECEVAEVVNRVSGGDALVPSADELPVHVGEGFEGAMAVLDYVGVA